MISGQPDFEHPDILDLAGLRAVIGPEPDGTVGADLDHVGSFVKMTPAEARSFAAALVKAADAAEHVIHIAGPLRIHP